MKQIEDLSKSSVPAILAGLGALFLLLSIVGGVSGQWTITISSSQRQGVALLGVALLGISVLTWFLPAVLDKGPRAIFALLLTVAIGGIATSSMVIWLLKSEGETAPAQVSPLVTTMPEPTETIPSVPTPVTSPVTLELAPPPTVVPAIPTLTPVPATATPMPVATAPQPLPITPTSTALSPWFGAPCFCLESTIDKVARRCQECSTRFTGNVPRVYVSWAVGNIYDGMNTCRYWYRDNVSIYPRCHTWDSEHWSLTSPTEYTYLDSKGLDGRPYFSPGNYRVDFFIEGQLVQQGFFSIEP